MKNTLLTALAVILAVATTSAQVQPQTNPKDQQKTTTTTNSNLDVTQEDYERMLKNAQNVAFRTYVLETLGLNEQEIRDFDPIYRDYMRDKNKLMQERYELLEDYADEIKENDSAKDEDEDKADFLENYWEIEIAEAKMEKDYFKKLEDKMSTDNAFSFFMLEDIAEGGITRHYVERRYIPFIIQMEKPSTGSTDKRNMGNNSMAKNANQDMSNNNRNNMANKANNTGTVQPKNNTAKSVNMKYKKDIDSFSSWAKAGRGKVALNHQYTHDGLISLANAISALYSAHGVMDDADFNNKKQQIITKAKKLQEDPKSTQHADWAREAFIMAAEMLESVHQKSGKNTHANAINEMKEAAKKIDPNQLMTPQAEKIYQFFDKAEAAVSSMSNGISWATN
jgi:hypothetical protein